LLEENSNCCTTERKYQTDYDMKFRISFEREGLEDDLASREEVQWNCEEE